ncbi:MAG: hypothetical protein E6G97_09135 [Alphaproteobacteria bacterium]|nr:MAG: hypothetical protein E6G97_09135 [Alphaproteobacteria bacterium]
MRRFVLIALAGAALAFAAPQFASAMPAGLGSGIGAAADNVSSTEVVHHRRWHHRHRHHHRHWRHHRRHHRH